MDINSTYLTNIPQELSIYGFSKVLVIRREIIHIKHILTEIFVRKSIDIEKYLNVLELSIFDYMEYITRRIRNVYNFPRDYVNELNEIVKNNRDNFFPTLDLYKGLNNIIILDFDGVVTSNNFKKLYELCVKRNKTIICSANPLIDKNWFIKNNYLLPNKIYSCKGKIKKIRKLIEIQKKHDYVFYVDNEIEYLEFGWLFGLQTYYWGNNKIKYFSLKTK